MLVCLATSSFCGRHPQPSLAAICSSYTGPSQCLQYLVYLQTYLEPCAGVLPTATSCVHRSRQHVWLHSLAWTRHEQAAVRDFPALRKQIHRCPRLQAASMLYLPISTRVTEKTSLTKLATIPRPFGRYMGARTCARIAKSCVRSFVQARCAASTPVAALGAPRRSFCRICLARRQQLQVCIIHGLALSVSVLVLAHSLATSWEQLPLASRRSTQTSPCWDFVA